MSDALDYQQLNRKASKKATTGKKKKFNNNMQLDLEAMDDDLLVEHQRKLNASLHGEVDNNLMNEAAVSPLIASGTIGDRKAIITRELNREQAQIDQFLRKVDKP